MVKAMITNKKSVFYGIALLIFIIIVVTIYKTVNVHYDKLNDVINNKIIEAAKRCYYEEMCLNEKILLKDLYELNYIEKVSNPVTKEYFKEESYVLRNGSKFSFVPSN